MQSRPHHRTLLPLAALQGAIGSFGATLASTLLLATFSEQSRYVYWLYGALCIFGALFLGKAIPHTEPVSLKAPLAVIRQPRFIACMPIFFLESGLFGISQAMAATGASNALGVASHYGWVSTVAGLAGAAFLAAAMATEYVIGRSLFWSSTAQAA